MSADITAATRAIILPRLDGSREGASVSRWLPDRVIARRISLFGGRLNRPLSWRDGREGEDVVGEFSEMVSPVEGVIARAVYVARAGAVLVRQFLPLGPNKIITVFPNTAPIEIFEKLIRHFLPLNRLPLRITGGFGEGTESAD